MPSQHSPARRHLVIGTPCFGGNVTSHFTLSLLRLQHACLERGVDLSYQLVGGDALITRARNLVVQQFMADPTATHLLFIDADIGFLPEQVFALLDADKDVCGAVYPLKRLEWDRIGAFARDDVANLGAAALNYVLDPAGGVDFSQPFLPVRSIGTGFMMIRRDVFIRMAARYPETHFGTIDISTNKALGGAFTYALFDCLIDPDSGTYLSEDYAFCKRWTAMGGEIWAWRDSRLTHIGPTAFHGDLTAMLAARGAL